LLVHGARQVVRVGAPGQSFKTGADMSNIHLLEGSCSVAVDSDGNIACVGTDEEVGRKYQPHQFAEVVDATGCVVIPGLVDAHTHPVWAGDRVHEFSLKMGGASYMEVQKAGGGIHFTVEKTRQASDSLLLELLVDRLGRMLRAGTTTAEVKSGYGLTTEDELRLLRIVTEASKLVAMDLAPTYLGAHAVPKGVSMEEATKDVIQRQIPAVLSAREKGEVNVENIDVFCESGVFDIASSRSILEAGLRGGLGVNAHVDELTPLGGTEMAAKLGRSVTVSHCEEISASGISALVASESAAVLLPTTQLLLQLPAPPARKMIQQGAIVALGSDFNPNAHCLAMPVVLHLACSLWRLSPAEVLSAATLNAAYSLRRQQCGAIQAGFRADMLVLDAPSWEHIVYQLGEHATLIRHVVCGGAIVHTRGTPAPPVVL